ncbi:MAG: hypothetical protein NVS4B3_18000 [Gemmatimonadaceae bacterium]
MLCDDDAGHRFLELPFPQERSWPEVGGPDLSLRGGSSRPDQIVRATDDRDGLKGMSSNAVKRCCPMEAILRRGTRCQA